MNTHNVFYFDGKWHVHTTYTKSGVVAPLAREGWPRWMLEIIVDTLNAWPNEAQAQAEAVRRMLAEGGEVAILGEVGLEDTGAGERS